MFGRLVIGCLVVVFASCRSRQSMHEARSSATLNHPNYNLGFEPIRSRGPLDPWVAIAGSEIQNHGYLIGLDSIKPHGGQFSLHINAGDSPDYCIVKQTNSIVRALRGKDVVYRGWVRMNGQVRNAGIALRATMAHDSLLIAPVDFQSNDDGLTDWRALTIATHIDSAAVDLELGVYMQGNGEAWFDDLSIDTNGVAYAK